MKDEDSHNTPLNLRYLYYQYCERTLLAARGIFFIQQLSMS